MDTQTNIINTDSTKKISWLELIPKLLAVFIPLGVALFFLFKIYDLINDNSLQIKALQTQIDEMKIDLHAKTDKHEFKDLDEKVTRQYSIFNDRMIRDVDPMKSWIEFHKGYLEGSKFKQ